jgi:hypothetical protein
VFVDGDAIYALFHIKAKRNQHHFFILFEHSWHSAHPPLAVTQTVVNWSPNRGIAKRICGRFASNGMTAEAMPQHAVMDHGGNALEPHF